jgi:hypothetical protein
LLQFGGHELVARQSPRHRGGSHRRRDDRGPVRPRGSHAPGRRWRDLARPTFVFGLLFVAVLISYAALEGKQGGGYLQRAAIVLLSVGVVSLALRVRALARSPGVLLTTRR